MFVQNFYVLEIGDRTIQNGTVLSQMHFPA